MIITDHWLESVHRDVIAGGQPMPIRRCLVMHFTSGASAKSSIESMRNNGLSCHLVIDRDGTIYQTRAFNVQCAHAGVSRWNDPKTGRRYAGANAYSIGIELANAGDDTALAKRQSALPLVKLAHRNEPKRRIEWEQFPVAQLAAATLAASAIVRTYNLDDVTGHDCIAPERKNDPGPAFPMQAFREALGFKGLPAVHYK